MHASFPLSPCRVGWGKGRQFQNKHVFSQKRVRSYNILALVNRWPKWIIPYIFTLEKILKLSCKHLLWSWIFWEKSLADFGKNHWQILGKIVGRYHGNVTFCQRFFPKFKIMTSVYFISRMPRECKNALQIGVEM